MIEFPDFCFTRIPPGRGSLSAGSIAPWYIGHEFELALRSDIENKEIGIQR